MALKRRERVAVWIAAVLLLGVIVGSVGSGVEHDDPAPFCLGLFLVIPTAMLLAVVATPKEK